MYTLISYEAMSERSFVTVLFVPSLNLALSPFIALIALLTARAKRSVRGGSGGGSVRAQDAFRTTMANVTSWTALLICVLMTILSVQIIRIGLTEINSQGFGILWMAGIVLVFFFVNLIRIMKRYGQGGALIETVTAETPLTNGLADNSHWVWGLFYVDRDDPSIMVEKRFGFGYTFNYGNRSAILIVGTFLVVSLGLAALVLIRTLT